MADRPANTARLVALLWLLAGALSVVVIVIRYARGGDIAWFFIGAAVFGLAMGWSLLKRSRSAGT